MKKRVLTWTLWLLLAATAAALLAYPKAVTEAAAQSLGLCARVVIPSLFPFFVLSSLVVSSGLAAAMGRPLGMLMRPVFSLPGGCAPALLLGLISGYPVGAKTTASLYAAGECDREEAERLLAFCNNAGPAFVIAAAGAGIWGSAGVGVLLYLTQTLASLCTGLLLRPGKKNRAKRPPPRPHSSPAAPSQPLSDQLVTAVKDAAMSLLYITAFIVFFGVLVRLLVESGLLTVIAAALGGLFSPLGGDAAFFTPLLTGFFEVTAGVAATSSLSPAAGIPLCAMLLGWSGLSVHCQVLTCLSGTGLSSKTYLLGKLLQTGLAGLLTAAALRLFPDALPAFSPVVPTEGAVRWAMAELTLTLIVLAGTTILFLLASAGFQFFKKAGIKTGNSVKKRV